MKMRIYLIFEDSVKHIGLKFTKIFKEAASKTIPTLTVFFNREDELIRINRLQLHSLCFDEEGRKTNNYVEARNLADMFDRALSGDEANSSNITYFSDYKRNNLSDIQKKLIIQCLEKDFGLAWEALDPAAKALFWSKGDTYRLSK